MGTPAQCSGYILATVSVQGFSDVRGISFAVPFMALALPIVDILFAVVRRLLKAKALRGDRGQSSKLVDMALTKSKACLSLLRQPACWAFCPLSLREREMARLPFLRWLGVGALRRCRYDYAADGIDKNDKK